MSHSKLHICLILIFLCSGCSRHVQPATAPDKAQSFTVTDLVYPLQQTPLFSAHRGGKYIDGYPENCLETFQYVISHRPMIIECDVAATADGTFILMHDKSVDRTTTGTGSVSSLSSKEVGQLRLLDHRGSLTDYTVPLLSDVLTWAAGHAILSLDLKKSVDKEQLLTLLREHKAHRYCEIITYNSETAKYFAKAAPEYTLSVSIRNDEELSTYVSGDFDLRKIKPFVGTRRKETEFYQKLHDEGLLVTLGTLGNIDQQALSKGYKVYDQLISDGVDILATDYPIEVATHFYSD